MDPRRIALVLVDIQKYFWQPLSEHKQFEDFPGNVGALLSEARARGLTIVHVRSSFKPDRSDWMLFYRPEGRGDVPCIEGTDGTLIEDFAAPLPGEPVIQKQSFDAFVDTGLGGLLEERGVSAALVAGLETSICVLFTATSAYLKRIVPLVVADACADEPSRHEATLRMYGDLCFKTVSTKQVQGDWASIISLVETFDYD
jgi:nicotinamidase-related amidase